MPLHLVPGDDVQVTEREVRLAADVRSLAAILHETGDTGLADRFAEDADRLQRGERYRFDVLWTDLGRDDWPNESARVLARQLRDDTETINQSIYGVR